MREGADQPLAVFQGLRLPSRFVRWASLLRLLQIFPLLQSLRTSVGTLLEVVGLHRHGRSPGNRCAENRREAPVTAPPVSESIEIRLSSGSRPSSCRASDRAAPRTKPSGLRSRCRDRHARPPRCARTHPAHRPPRLTEAVSLGAVEPLTVPTCIAHSQLECIAPQSPAARPTVLPGIATETRSSKRRRVRHPQHVGLKRP